LLRAAWRESAPLPRGCGFALEPQAYSTPFRAVNVVKTARAGRGV